MTNRLAFAVALLAQACAVTGDDDAHCSGGKCDGDGNSCSDKRYGDGVCQTDLDCAVPDIDCFRTFDDDAQAAAWFSEFEAATAMQQNRAPRSLVPATDPRFQRVRELADRGWAAFQSQRPVGKLAEHRPALVVIEDPVVNAFVAPDIASNTAGFAIMVQTGLIEQMASDDSKLGVMMHELQHAVGLHVVGDVKDKIRRFYLATDGNEPIGRTIVDDARARAALTTWQEPASEVGGISSAVLGGFPTGNGTLQVMLDRVAGLGTAANASACAHANQLIADLRADLPKQADPLTGAMPDQTARADAALAALRDECLAGFTQSFIDVLADMFGTTPDMIQGSIPPDDLALVSGKHVVDAIAAVAVDRRAKMRAIEARFERDVAPWSSLRYFSFEEDADDTSVMVLRGTQYKPAAIADFFVSVLPEAARAQCSQLIDARRAPPYGVNLFDPHHAVCWRAYHVNAFADSLGKTGAFSAVARTIDVPVAHLPRIPFPEQLADRIAY